MFVYKQNLEDIEKRLVVEFEKDYSNEPEKLKDIAITVDDAFFEWFHSDILYEDEEERAEVDCMNPGRFITERLDAIGYLTVNYYLENLEQISASLSRTICASAFLLSSSFFVNSASEIASI